MAAGMGLWSCTSDEALSGGEAYGEPIPVTITLSRGDAQTRTELSENAEGGLDDKWLRNDQLVVINSNNEEVGVLEFVKYVDDSKPNEAVFQGTLEGVADGVYDYTLWYLGGNGTQRTPLSEFLNDYKVDGGNPMLVKTTLTRQTGKLNDLVRGDLLSKQIKIRVSDHKAAVEQSLDAASRTMTAHLAMASIKLEGVGGVTDGTLKISHAPSNIDPVYKVYFDRYSTSSVASRGAKENPLIIDHVNTSEPVYMVLYPAPYSGNTALVLTLTSGDKTWTATLPDITMEAGKYYRNGADGKQFSVTMTESNKEVKLVYHANFTGATTETYEETQTANNGEVKFTVDSYQKLIKESKLPSRMDYISFGWSRTPDGEIEDLTTISLKDGETSVDLYAVWTDQSKNPLKKWAEKNLVYNEATDKSDFASSNTIGGSLYQWGRNHGYVDYKDAMGELTTDYNLSPYPFYPYASTQDNDDYSSGAGIFTTYNNVGHYSYMWYTEVKDITDYPKIFFMDGDINNPTYDYWVFNGGGNDWVSRARACGYSTPNPAPKGYRLPTFNDFKEILPSKGINQSDNLSSLMPSPEVKNTNDNTSKYVIKWILENNGIMIQAMIIPTKYSSSNISDISDEIWSDYNVTSRFFPFTGGINAYYDEIKNINGFTFDRVARPMPYFSSFDKNLGYKNLGSITVYWSNFRNIIDAGINSMGAYWCSDRNNNNRPYAMKFLDNSKFSSQNSKFAVFVEEAHNAFAIRCVKE